MNKWTWFSPPSFIGLCVGILLLTLFEGWLEGRWTAGIVLRSILDGSIAYALWHGAALLVWKWQARHEETCR